MTLWYLSKKTDFYANLIDYSIRLLCPCHVLCGWCPACRGSRYTGGQCSSKPPGAYDVGGTSFFGVLQWRPPVSVLSSYSVHCATWGEFHNKMPNTPDMSWWLSLFYHCKSRAPHPQLAPSEVLSSPVPLQHKQQICPGLIQKLWNHPDLQLEPRILPDLQLEPRILPDLQLEPRILLDLSHMRNSVYTEGSCFPAGPGGKRSTCVSPVHLPFAWRTRSSVLKGLYKQFSFVSFFSSCVFVGGTLLCVCVWPQIERDRTEAWSNVKP